MEDVADRKEKRGDQDASRFDVILIESCPPPRQYSFPADWQWQIKGLLFESFMLYEGLARPWSTTVRTV